MGDNMSTKTAKINLKAMSLDDRNEHLQRFVREVAEFLGGWTYLTPEYAHRAQLALTDEKGPVISARVEGDRVIFTGIYPEGTYQRLYGFGQATVRTTVDINRDPRLVASQIAHRLVGEYLERYNEARMRLAELDDSEAAKKATAERLAKPGGWRVHDDLTFTAWGPKHAGYAEVKVYSGGEQVNVDARGVSVEQAEAILAIIERG